MEIDGVLATDAGLFGLWSPTAFRGIVDYESWESVLLADEDILRQVTSGVFVPITIGADGAFQFLARVGSASAPADFSVRERAWAAVTSEPYLFVATEVPCSAASSTSARTLRPVCASRCRPVAGRCGSH